MNKALKNRLLSVLLLVAVWVASLCVMVSPAHACCQKANIKVGATVPACCVSHATVLPKAPPQNMGGNSGVWLSASALPDFAPLWASAPQGKLLSLLAKRHVPDQSDRHLELNVWLN